MRITRIVLAVAFAAFAVAAWAKYEAAAEARLSFDERWAAVDEAIHSGSFHQQQSPAH